MLAELVERRRTDEPQLTAREHRLEHVARVHRTLAGRAGADDGVQLVDEGDDLAVAGPDLLEDGLQPLLELAAVLRTGDHRPEVEADEPLVAQALGHVAVDDALRQTLDDGGLADAGLADEDGLFFVRRESTWTTRRISESRPMTGSSLPSRAIWVRSVPYSARASPPSVGVSEVTLRPARSSSTFASRSAAPRFSTAAR